MSSIYHLHSETEMLQVEDHLNLFSAQYLVHCLNTENVCHHITKTIHTSFVNREIDNMTDNIIPNNRPPPINDDKLHLSRRRQRATQSQLRFGHCKLLYSYDKRLKLTDSSSYPDCGTDPQDVPHLFSCTAHPTNLSHVNLWDKPVNTIRELRFIDSNNLD